MDALQHLEAIRAVADANAAVLAAIIDDPDAIHLLAVWQVVPQQWTPPAGEVPPDMPPWEYLWVGHTLNIDALASASSVKEFHVQATFKKLKALRAIFPDGTISKAGQLVCVGHVQSKIGTRRPKPPGQK